MRQFQSLLLAGSLMATALTGCIKDPCTAGSDYVTRTPIVMTCQEIRSNLTATTPQAGVKQIGKIVAHNNTLYINEPGIGIHVFDNSNPASPVNISFIRIPGSTELASNGSNLYVNTPTDLVTFDISTPGSANLLSIAQDVFVSADKDVDGNIIVGYDIQHGGNVDCPNLKYSQGLTDLSAPAQSSGTGTPGSTARMVVVGSALIVLDANQFKVFDISNPSTPRLANSIPYQGNIETLFAGTDEFYAGTTTGMECWETEGTNVSFKYVYSHVRSCDPVVVQDDKAYFTTRGGNGCGESSSSLSVLNADDASLIGSREMKQPYGLALSENKAYVCDGPNGINVVDISNPSGIRSSNAYPVYDDFALDALVQKDRNLLMVTGKLGLSQYAIAQDGSISRVSTIKIQ